MPNPAVIDVVAQRAAQPAWTRSFVAWLERWEGFALVLALAGCCLSPLLASPFINDDIHGSTVAGLMRVRSASLTEMLGERLTADLDAGRVAPLGSLAVVCVSYALGDVRIHKAFVLSLALANLALFYGLLRTWGMHHTPAQWSLLAVALCFQFRLRNDPLLELDGVMQALVCLLIGSLFCLEHYLRSERRGWLAASAAIYAVMLLLDETSYALTPIYAATIYAKRQTWRPTLQGAAPYLGLSVAMLLAVVGARLWRLVPGSQVLGLHWSLPKIVNTAFWQAAAPVPLSFMTFCGAKRADIWQPGEWFAHGLNWLALGGAGILCFFLLRRLGEDPGAAAPPPRVALPAGLAWWIGPALVPACVGRVQDLSHPGLAAPAAYVQCFGLAIVAACGVGWLAARLPRQWSVVRAVVSLAVAGVALVTCDGNRAVIRHWSGMTDFNTRAIIEEAFRHGLGDEIPEGATLLVTTWRSWLDVNRPERAAAFYSACAGRRINVANATPGLGPISRQRDLTGAPRPAFAVCEQCPDETSGYVILSQVDEPDEAIGAGGAPDGGSRAESSPGDVVSDGAADDPLAGPPVVRRFHVFVRDKSLNSNFFAAPNQLFGHRPGASFGARDRPGEIFEVSGLRPVRRGRGWAIYEGEFHSPVDVATLGMAGHAVVVEIHCPRVASRR